MTLPQQPDRLRVLGRVAQLGRPRVLAAWLLAGCSVYDASLLQSSVDASGGSPETSGAAGNGSTDGGGSGGQAASVGGKGSGAASASGGLSGAPDGGTSSLGGGAGEGGDAGDGGITDGGAPPATDLQELVTGKNALASSFQTANPAPRGNDGDVLTRWCAVNGSFPQWWRVDLGASHQLRTFSVRFEYPERKHSYSIETSEDDMTYVAVPGATFTDVVGEVQSGDFPSGASARYVRIVVTNAAPPTDPNASPKVTWASFFEFSVMGI